MNNYKNNKRFIKASDLLKKGHALNAQNKDEEAILAYDEIINEFGTSKETCVLEIVAEAIFHKALCYDHIEKNEEAIALYDEVGRRFEGYKDDFLRFLVVFAMERKAYVYDDQKMHEKAVSIFDEIIQRYSQIEDKDFLECVLRALAGKRSIIKSQINNIDGQMWDIKKKLNETSSSDD